MNTKHETTTGQGHTPGPWKPETVSNDKGQWAVQIHGNRCGGSAVLVAEMPIEFKTLPDGPHATFDLQVANARLIAAAPDLLAALESFLRLLDEEYGADVLPYNLDDEADAEVNTVVLAARAAIQKAKGATNGN